MPQIAFNYNKATIAEQYFQSRKDHDLLQRIESALVQSGWNDYEIRTAQLLTVIDFNVKQAEQIRILKATIEKMVNGH